MRKIHSTLHKALSGAVSDGLIPRNAADVKAPRPTPKEMRLLSEEEARTFLEATRGDPFETFYVLVLTTGLRRGELLGHATIAHDPRLLQPLLPSMGDQAAGATGEALG